VAKPLIVVVGSCNTDLTVFCEELPSPGQTVIGGELREAAGGKGANQAVAAARAGAEVVLVARVGGDYFSRRRLSDLRREGIRDEFIVLDRDVSGGVALITVDSRGENLISVARGANARLSPQDVLAARDAIAKADVMLVQLEIPMATVEAAIEAGSRSSVRVVLDPAPAPRRGVSAGLLSRVDYLTPNRAEAARLLEPGGEGEPEQLAARLVDAGVKTAVVTLGAQGACVCSMGECYRVAAAPVTSVVDSVGAGDCFAGALSVAVAEHRATPEAVEFAVAAASISVERKGAQPSLPYRDEIERRLRT